MERLPAFPLIVNDPYFSYWMPADLPTEDYVCHWAGDHKAICGSVEVDGRRYRYLGKMNLPAAITKDIEVTATQTKYFMQAGPVELQVVFRTAMLPDDLDVLSTPITTVEYTAVSTDGKEHTVNAKLILPSTLCYDGNAWPEIIGGSFRRSKLNISYAGKSVQPVLCHSGDHITIDWGYLYLASEQKVSFDEDGLIFQWDCQCENEPKSAYCLVGYDDIASIDYFGTLCKAWYARNGKTLPDAMNEFAERYAELKERCERLDREVKTESVGIGGQAYARITAAAWRHTFAAHKLIATPEKELAFLSKENDSNGCIGTVDVSYPSTPVFLKYCPELVSALARPIMKFASLPVWRFDFAPHDVGRYPHAIGQVYALKKYEKEGKVYFPAYLYDADADIYDDRYQMPVEEAGNMIVMIYSAIFYGASDELARENMDTLKKWVNYLDRFGDDPGEQLCTDDFAGHLSHNVNLSAKAIVGVKCYSELLKHFGETQEAERWSNRAQEMAAYFLKRIDKAEGAPLTFDGKGWSMKYNLVWDRLLNLNLFPAEFYERETKSYLARINRYGLPLDSRSDYTKSDWECWIAAMTDNNEVKTAIFGAISDYLSESKTRVAFSDWYDTKTGDFEQFIARSVQGGVFMPMLRE